MERRQQSKGREANSRSKEGKIGAKEGTEKRMKLMVGRRIQDKQQQTHLTFVDVQNLHKLSTHFF